MGEPPSDCTSISRRKNRPRSRCSPSGYAQETLTSQERGIPMKCHVHRDRRWNGGALGRLPESVAFTREHTPARSTDHIVNQRPIDHHLPRGGRA
jgi:hypothetical protein